MQIQVGAYTHPGRVRSENQDRLGRWISPLGEVFVVADGMGGVKGGAAAARLAVERLEFHLSEASPYFDPVDALRHAASLVHDDILTAASADPSSAGMGATVVLALVEDERAVIGHAGDSRAYRFRNGRLSRLTEDHSLVQKMLDHRMLTEAEARVHPDSNVVTRAMGQAGVFELAVSEPLPLQPGDAILLCTDGLFRGLDDRSIESLIRRSGADPALAGRTLLEEALIADGEDNISLQLLRFTSPDVRREPCPSPWQKAWRALAGS